MPRRNFSARFLAVCVFTGFLFALLLLWHLPVSQTAAQSCSFAISPNSQNFAYGGGAGSSAVTASAGNCNWAATSNAAWVTITSGASGTGNGVVVYSVAANPTAAMRTGTLTIAGQTFTITQDAGQGGLVFYPLPKPIRLLETRPGQPGCDAPGAPIVGGTSRTQTAAGRTCDGVLIPNSARAITGHITSVESGGGYLTLYPSDATQPLVANTNYLPNEIVNNVFTVGLGAADGAFKIFALATTHVVVDLTGYYAPPGAGGLYFHPLPKPVRLLETRAGEPGCDAPGAPLSAGSIRTQATAGRVCDGVTIPANAKAITGNATVVFPAGIGFLTLFPSNVAQPLAASSNYAAGQIVNGPFTVGLGVDGAFKIFTLATTDLVVDVQGYFSDAAVDVNGVGMLFSPLPTPVRLLETRVGESGCFTPGAPLTGGLEYLQPATGVCQGVTIPATARGVVGNATVVFPQAGGFLTFWPSNVLRPLIATSNFNAGQIWNRHFTAGLGPDGAFRMFSLATTDLVVDLSGYFNPPPVNQTPLADAGPDRTAAPPTNVATLTGAASDDGLPSGALAVSWSKVSGPGMVNFSAPNSVATNATFDQSGVYVLRLTASDSQLSATDEVTVTVNQPLAVNAGADQIITLPNTAMLIGAVTGGSGTVTFAWSKVSGPDTVIFGNASALGTTAIFRVQGVYVLRLTATDAVTTVSDDVQVTVNPDPTPPPPDPATVAPPLDMTVATTIGLATEFLYTGPNPIQIGVAPGTINKVRAAVLKGRVLDKNNQPLPLAKITVLGHPEFGHTFSRADGRFDLAVNGGGVLTIQYEKIGFQTLQRTDNVPWQDYCGIPDVVMIGYDPAVTMINLLAATPIQVAQSSINSDSSGARRTALLFAQGTTATMQMPGGGMAGLDKLHVRATEFTVGTNGFNAMPGDLPANSGYTYAVDYSIDEAVAAGALETTFSQPVIQYNENFLNFPVGINIPSGAYDPMKGQWIASTSGRVVKILSITAGTANLDLNGSGQPATDPQYAALGITVPERQTLATLYAVNQVLWRVPIIHFTSWDSNWPIKPPDPPNGGPPANPPPDCDT